MKTHIIRINYKDLIAFSSGGAENDQVLVDKVQAAFGKDGLGILSITEIPDFDKRRRALLPLAAVLPTLPDIDQCIDADSLYSTGWSFGKEQLASGGPDVAKGSFYANPLTDHLLDSLIARDGRINHWKQLAQEHPPFYADNLWPESLPELRVAFKDMGQMIAEIGCMLAGVCDEFCRQQGVNTNLQATLTRALNFKDRLLHYFPIQKNGCDCVDEKLWCGWHNDHGSLTGLVSAMYIDSQGHVIECPDESAGLYIQTRSNEVVKIELSSDVLSFQIGETSQIHSGGVLRATPHAVRPTKLPGVSRESFALFLEPEFEDPLDIPANKTLEDCQESGAPLPASVLPLKARWKPGQTFGDFHVATFKAFTT